MKVVVLAVLTVVVLTFGSYLLVQDGLDRHHEREIEKIKAAKEAAIMEEIEKELNQRNKEPTMEEIKKWLEKLKIHKKISSMAGPVVTMAIVIACKKHGVDLVDGAALAWTESKYDPKAVSRKGALGVFQIMPKLYRVWGGKNPFDPFENADIGIKHFKKLLKRYGGNYLLVLAAYNAGPTNVRRFGGQPPFPETKKHYEKFVAIKNKILS